MPRPKGSKNKPKYAADGTLIPPKTKQVAHPGQRGRPKGSKNKPKEAPVVDITAKQTDKPKHKYTVSEKALEQRRNNRMIKDPKTPEDIAYNARLIGHIIHINEIASHADKNDLLSLRSCFVAYLELCQQDGFPVTNLAAYASMGFDMVRFDLFSKKDNPEQREFCRWVRKTCSMFREAMVAGNKLNPVIGIFWQRNFDGLRNDTETVQPVREMEEDEASGSGAYKEKYKNLIGD